MVDIWSEVLDDIPDSVFIRACKLIIASQTFFPAISEIREKCMQLMNGFGNSGHAVFDSLKSEMFRICHAYVAPEEKKRAWDAIADPVAKKAAQVFDWRACGVDDEANQGIHKAHFAKLYEHYAKEIKFENDTGRIAPGIHRELKKIINHATKGF